MNLTRTIFIASFFALAIFLPGSTSAQSERHYCTMQYEPVCGAKPVQCITAPCYPQYQTYGNACTMANDKATLIHKGECTTEESGPMKELSEATSTPFSSTPKDEQKYYRSFSFLMRAWVHFLSWLRI